MSQINLKIDSLQYQTTNIYSSKKRLYMKVKNDFEGFLCRRHKYKKGNDIFYHLQLGLSRGTRGTRSPSYPTHFHSPIPRGMNFGSPRFPDSPPIIPRFPEHWKISRKNWIISEKMNKIRKKNKKIRGKSEKCKFFLYSSNFG